MSEILTTNATLTTYAPLSDGSLSIRFVTQEVDSVEILHREFLRQWGRLYFVKGAALPELTPPEGTPSRWSMSQRLRFAINRLADVRGVADGEKEEFYRAEMAALIAKVEIEIGNMSLPQTE